MNGIFVRTTKYQDDVITECNKLLTNIHSQARINGVIQSDSLLCQGIKVFLNGDSTAVTHLIKTKLLNDYDDASIHSLTTALTFDHAIPTDEAVFKVDIENQVQNMAPVRVLSVSSVPVSIRHPEINSGKWMIVLDVPDVPDLLVFRTLGLPDRMFLESPVDGSTLRVRFYCGLCQRDGHTEFSCLGGVPRVPSVEILCESPGKSRLSGTRRVGLFRSPNESPRKKVRFELSSGTSSGACGSNDSQRVKNSAVLETLHWLPMPQDIRHIVQELHDGALCVQKLEAFIVYAQNEADPFKFAMDYYTTDVKGLHKQLKDMSRVYYQQLEMLSEDNQRFMDLVRNVLERFSEIEMQEQ